MSSSKIVIEVADRDHARTYAAALGDLVDPPPAALTLFENGAQWRIEAYFDAETQPDDLARDLADLTELPAPQVREEVVPDLNWVAISQAALPPVQSGRFTVHGSHDRHRVARGPNALEIEAGEAFGTAHHATTAGCLAAIDRVTRRRRFRRALDLGCGTGVLAIALARALPACRIDATDIDATSVVVANANIRLNGASRRIRARAADGLPKPVGERHYPARYDLVVANILAGPLISLAQWFGTSVRRGGCVILSGILVPQAPAVLAAFGAAGFVVKSHTRLSGWSTIVLVRR